MKAEAQIEELEHKGKLNTGDMAVLVDTFSPDYASSLKKPAVTVA